MNRSWHKKSPKGGGEPKQRTQDVISLRVLFPERLLKRLDHFRVSFQRVIDHWNVIDLALIMTLILLMFKGRALWYISIPSRLLCIAALIYPPLRKRASFWLVFATVLFLGYLPRWFTIDNNVYLIFYWCLALGCCFLTRNPERSIAWNGRILLGLTFLFAATQKTLSTSYFDGSFFHLCLLADPRFQGVSEILGGLPYEMSLQNHRVFRSLFRYNNTLYSVPLQETLLIPWLAQFLTWWTRTLEATIGICFLWPEGKFISKWRDFPLLLFMFTTYTSAKVLDFGWILVCMAMAQSGSTFRYSRFLYILAFFAIQIYAIPWGRIF